MKKIASSEICIADLSEPKDNLYYELGYALALNKPVVLIRDEKSKELPAFVDEVECISYSMDDVKKHRIAVSSLRKTLIKLVGKDAGEEKNALMPKRRTLPAKVACALMLTIALVACPFIIKNGMNSKNDAAENAVVDRWSTEWASFFASDQMFIAQDTPCYAEPDLNAQNVVDVLKAGYVLGSHSDGEWFEIRYTDSTVYAPKEYAIPMYMQADSKYAQDMNWADVVPVCVAIGNGAEFYESVDPDGSLGKVTRVLSENRSILESISHFSGKLTTDDGKIYWEGCDGWVAEEDMTIFYASRADLETFGYTDYQESEFYKDHSERIQ